MRSGHRDPPQGRCPPIRIKPTGNRSARVRRAVMEGFRARTTKRALDQCCGCHKAPQVESIAVCVIVTDHILCSPDRRQAWAIRSHLPRPMVFGSEHTAQTQRERPTAASSCYRKFSESTTTFARFAIASPLPDMRRWRRPSSTGSSRDSRRGTHRKKSRRACASFRTLTSRHFCATRPRHRGTPANGAGVGYGILLGWYRRLCGCV
jgi:hypothetical protein